MSIAVVIPTYYRSKDLSQLFDSIIIQNVKPFEVIIVDDTPDYSVKKICMKYYGIFKNSGIRLTYIKNVRERSTTIARNIGIEKSDNSIEFVTFLDSDVILSKDYFEKILDVFNNERSAVGVQGWREREYALRYYHLNRLFCRIFFLGMPSINSARYFEYPFMITKTINAEWLSGSNVTFRKNILRDFRFDEHLKKYAYSEDKLFSHSIFKKFSNGLFITPYARYIHKRSREGRMNKIELNIHQLRCRKYILRKLFGYKGIHIFYLQSIGESIVKLLRFIHFL